MSAEMFICPITAEFMVDPVVDPEGNSYERVAIETWLARHGTSPITRKPLRVSDLAPNRALKEAIEQERRRVAPVQESKRSESKSESKMDVQAKADHSAASSPLPPANISMVFSHTAVDQALAMVSVTTADLNIRGPIDVCCVVDISGSMNNEAEANGLESNGLSILDIVKHAVKTIINSLTNNDRLSLVSFSNSAKVVFPLIQMTEAGKARAMTDLESLAPMGMTNLWDGLKQGLQCLSEGNSDRGFKGNSAVFLLTDGEPNIDPPRGILPMLKLTKEKSGGDFPGTICTFGFGYSLNSILLRSIAIEGRGNYAFIPDSGFVGTAFVHALGKMLSI